MSLSKPSAQQRISTFDEFMRLADYSLMDILFGFWTSFLLS
jgi:hypothetical protein